MNSFSPGLDGLLDQLDQKLDDLLVVNEDQTQGLPRLKFLAEKIKAIVPAIIAVGEAAHLSTNQGTTDTLQNQLICYEWADCGKSFLILARDILYEEQKAWLAVSSKKTTLAAFENLVARSQDVLTAAVADFQTFLERETDPQINQSVRLKNWKLQDNPWPIYKSQIEQFPKQVDDLVLQCESLWNASGVFVVIHSQIMDVFRQGQDEIDELKAEIQKLVKAVEAEEDYPTKNVINGLDTLYNNLTANDQLGLFKETLDLHLGKLPGETKIFVDSKDGAIYYKDLDLQDRTRAWLESEVMSEIYNLNTIKESIQNKVNLSKVNLSSRIALLQGEKEGNSKEEVLSVLQKFLKSLEKSRQKMTELEGEVQAQLKTYFDLGKISKDNFLPVSMQYTLKQYQEGERLKFVKDWFKKQGSVWKEFRESVREEGALSISEKVVRVVKERSSEVANSHYTNMFLTKGYIGDSFLVGRTKELQHISSLVDNWQLGFRGSLLLTGTRFSGKTLLGELVGQRFFPQQTIKIKPQSKIQLSGRFFDTEFDLGKVLNFVIKNTLNQPAMVWIDDLEFWEDDKISFAENVVQLLNAIDNYNGRLFFVVGCSNWMKDHLQKVFEIEKVFQSEINLDRMEAAEVEKAILTRHSATHMELVGADEDDEISTNRLRLKINQIYRNANGNIGEALQGWAYSITKFNEEKVTFKEETNSTLPNFLSADSALLLRAIMMEKRTNEYRLRKLFGPAFKDKYKVILQRLASLGVVKRDLGNWLEVNPALANNIGQQLERFTDFRFQNKKVLIEDLKL